VKSAELVGNGQAQTIEVHKMKVFKNTLVAHHADAFELTVTTRPELRKSTGSSS